MHYNIVPGSMVRCYHFKPTKGKEFFLEGTVDGYFYDTNGEKYLCVEVEYDNFTQKFEDFQLIPVDLKEYDWENRIEVIGFDKQSVDA